MASAASSTPADHGSEADKEWIDVDKAGDDAANLDKNGLSSAETEALPSPSSTVHGNAELKAATAGGVDAVAPILIKNDEDSETAPQDHVADIDGVASELQAHAKASNAEPEQAQSDEKLAESVGEALHPTVTTHDAETKTESGEGELSVADSAVKSDDALSPHKDAEAVTGPIADHESATETAVETDKPAHADEPLEDANVSHDSEHLLETSASATPMSEASDDVPFSAYEHALKKQASLRKSQEPATAAKDASHDTATVTSRPSQDTARASKNADETRSLRNGSIRSRSIKAANRDSLILDKDTEDLAATLSQIEYGPEGDTIDEEAQAETTEAEAPSHLNEEAQKTDTQGKDKEEEESAPKPSEAATSNTVASPASEDAPSLPPKSPTQVSRYALPIGGPNASGPRPELVALLRAPQSTTSLRSHKSAVSSKEPSKQAEGASTQGTASQNAPKKAGPSSPRRRSSLPKLLVATAVAKGKARARSKSIDESSSDSEMGSAIDHRKGSVSSTLAPLVEEDRERGSGSERDRPETPMTEASMETAKEDLDDGGPRESEDEYKEARSTFTARFTAPAMAALGSALQARKAPVRRVRGKRSVEGARAAPMTDDEDYEDVENLKPVSPKRPPRSPRSLARLPVTPTKATSASTISVDGQVFAVDDETDEYEDLDVDSTPKASRMRKPRASFSGLGRRERTASTASSPATPVRTDQATTSNTVDKSLFVDAGEQMKRPVRAEHEPMIYDEDELEDLPPPGSYANHPPSRKRLAEAAELVLYDDAGSMLKFGTIFAKRRTLIIFLRHWLCPFCQMFAQSIQAVDPLPLEKAELDMVVVGQGHWHVTKSYKEVMGIPDFVRMYADPSRKIYNALGMTLRTNDLGPACARPDYQTMGVFKASMKAIKKGVVDMPLRVPGDLKLLGGEFVLGPGLQCSFTHRMVTTRGHLDLPRVLEQVGCDLSLKSPERLAQERANRPASVRSDNRRGVRRAAHRIARRARPATPREALAVKSSRAAALAAQQRVLTTQRTSGSLSRQYASTLVKGENGDYIVDVGPPRLSGDGISLSHTTPKRSSPHRRQTSGTIRPPLPLSSSASAYAAAFARQRNYATGKAEEPTPQREQLTSDSMPALLAGVPPRTRAVSHQPAASASVEELTVPSQISQSYDTPANDSLYSSALLQPSAFATPRKPLAPRPATATTTTRARAPSVGRNTFEDIRPQARTSSMRGNTSLDAAARAASMDMDNSRSTSSSGRSLNRMPAVPMRYASNAPALPLSGSEQRLQERSRGSISSIGHNEASGNPLLSSVVMGQPQSSPIQQNGSESGHQSNGHVPESQYASPLLSSVMGASASRFASPPVSSSGHGAPARSFGQLHAKPAEPEDETEYKRLAQNLLERQRLATDYDENQSIDDDPTTRALLNGQPEKQMSPASSETHTTSGTNGPLFASLNGRTPKGRIISLHADEFNDAESQRTSLDGSRAGHGAAAEAIPPVPPLPKMASQASLSSRAPQPAFVPAFASVLAAEEARKTASSTGHGSYESASLSDITHTPRSQPAPWHDAVFGGNAQPALFAGLPSKGASGVSRENSTASSTYKAAPQSMASAQYYNPTSPPRTASSAASGSFLDDLNTIDGYNTHLSRTSGSMDASRPESTYRANGTMGLSQLDSSTSLSSDFGEPFMSQSGPLFAALGQDTSSGQVGQESRKAGPDGSANPTSPLLAAATGVDNYTYASKPTLSNASSPTSPRRPPRAYTPSTSAALLAAGNSNGGQNRLSSFTEEDEDDPSPKMPANLALFAAQRVQ